MINYVDGDLLEIASEFDIIVHGCNCFCTMGSGIAKQIRRKYPEVYKADKQTKKGDKDKLGTITSALAPGREKPIVVNAYTQHTYGKGKHIDYAAVADCMDEIKKLADDLKQHREREIEIGMPKIGSGLAGGDWWTIEKLIKHNLGKYHNVTVVNYNK